MYSVKHGVALPLLVPILSSYSSNSALGNLLRSMHCICFLTLAAAV
jgi:hypothetical protein